MRKVLLSAAAVLVLAVAVTAPASADQPSAQTSKIVFSRSTGRADVPKKNEIFLMDADGSNEVRLTENVTEDAFPNLSPDGSSIAFSRFIDGQYDLFVMEVNGQEVQRLTRSRADEVLPDWSPDGTWVVFTKTFTLDDGNWQSDIFKMRLRDRAFRRITDTPRTKEFAPDWSPDGESIAFTKQNQRRERYGISVSRPNGDELTWLVINPRTKAGYTDVNPSWSPDSQWVAFSRDHGDDPYVDIYKIRRDGSEVTAITQLFELAENPVWGPDDMILFSYREGLAVVAADGGNVQHITPTVTGRPYWWPDW